MALLTPSYGGKHFISPHMIPPPSCRCLQVSSSCSASLSTHNLPLLSTIFEALPVHQRACSLLFLLTTRITEKAREFQKNICFIGHAKACGCVDHNKLEKFLKEMGIPDHLTCLSKKSVRQVKKQQLEPYME